MDFSTFNVVSVLVVLGTAIWAAADASSIRSRLSESIHLEHPAVIFLAFIALWIVAFPYYLVKRSRVLAEQARLEASPTFDIRARIRQERLDAEEKGREDAARAAAAPASQPTSSSLEERLRRVDSLKEQGLITQDEYERKRTEILETI